MRRCGGCFDIIIDIVIRHPKYEERFLSRNHPTYEHNCIRYPIDIYT